MKKILMIALFILLPSQAWGTVRYLDVNLASDCTSGNYSIANRACNGSDGNAYNNISDFEGVALSAGDIVYIRAGNYSAQGLDTNWNGSAAGGQITFEGYQSEDVNFTGTVSESDWLIDNNYITIKNIDFNQTGSGYYVRITGHHNIIDGCDFAAGTGWSGNISIEYDGNGYNEVKNSTFVGTPTTFVSMCYYSEFKGCNYNTIDNCTFSAGEEYMVVIWSHGAAKTSRYNQVKNSTFDGTGGTALGLSLNTDNPYHGGTVQYTLVENNVFKNIAVSAGTYSSTKSGIQLYGDYTTVRKNRFYGFGSEASSYGIELSAASGCLIYNNTFYDNWNAGIVLGWDDYHDTKNITIKNNLFYRNKLHDDGFSSNSCCDGPNNPWSCCTGSGTGTCGNNYDCNGYQEGAAIMWPHDDAYSEYSNEADFETTSGHIISNNFLQYITINNDPMTHYYQGGVNSFSFIYSLSEAESNLNNIFSANVQSAAGPGMIDPANADFTLATGSACIDAGVVVTDATWGNLSYSGSAPDIGAYEYEGGDTTDPTCTITTNSGSNYTVSARTINLEGSAEDGVAVSSIAWACSTCTPTSGSATCTSCPDTDVTWSITSGQLGDGANTITVTATDSSSNESDPDSIVVTYEPQSMSGCTIQGGSFK